jgi:hypothetical protein
MTGKIRQASVQRAAIHQCLAASSFYGSDESAVFPAIHAGALNGILPQHVHQLRPNVAGEAFRFDSGQHGGNFKKLGGLGHRDDVVLEKLAVNAGDAKRHLRLVVDKYEGTVIRCDELFGGCGHGDFPLV